MKPAPRVSAEPQLLAKTSRAIPHASVAEIHAPVSSAHSVVDVIAAAVVVQTAVEAVPIVEAMIAAAAPAVVRDSNAVPAVPVARATIVVIVILVRRAVRSSSAKC